MSEWKTKYEELEKESIKDHNFLIDKERYLSEELNKAKELIENWEETYKDLCKKQDDLETYCEELKETIIFLSLQLSKKE